LRSLPGSSRTDDPDVHVCENPSVLIAAADELGTRSLPLVCTNGRPSAAALRLFTGLATTGTTLYVGADDDAAGQEIVARLQMAIPGLNLWRFALRPRPPRGTRNNTYPYSWGPRPSRLGCPGGAR
jgi:uncharacterized protein (TIGR02679 family)